MSIHGPVRPTESAAGQLRPLPLSSSRITGGLWADRQRTNREVSIPLGSRRLREAGNLEDLALATEQLRSGRTVDRSDYRGPVFMDSDVHKWLEAVAWECAREPSQDLRAEVELFSEALEQAQAADGYLNSFVQATRGDDRYRDLAMGHEHYCMGHLLQAAVAAHRSFGDCRLWQLALRVADHLTETFGPSGSDGLDGHPVVEMALVELFRETGEQRYLDLATHFVTTRGRGTIQGYGREPIYYSDRVPVREASAPEGHAVRAVYLAAGASDVVTECGDPDGNLGGDLDAALERQWEAMVRTKRYLTGGLGSRWDGEAFGDPYELPPDLAYAETCASIGAVQWAWRQLLRTGRASYADAIERTLLNGFLSGVSLSGDEFFYVNALQVRDGAVPQDRRDASNGRQQWFTTACCPPNIMRTLAQLGGYLASTRGTDLVVHQYAAAELEHGDHQVTIQTDYPWDGRVRLTVTGGQEASSEWGLGLRVPEWCVEATLTEPDGTTSQVAPGYVTVSRRWRDGDTVVLDLPMPVRLSAGHPRVDAVRGCRAVERGPLVYAVEQVDLHEGRLVDELRLDPEGKAEVTERPDLLGGCVTVEVPVAGPHGHAHVTAVPYALWANRGPGPMRVWLPLAPGADEG